MIIFSFKIIIKNIKYYFYFYELQLWKIREQNNILILCVCKNRIDLSKRKIHISFIPIFFDFTFLIQYIKLIILVWFSNFSIDSLPQTRFLVSNGGKRVECYRIITLFLYFWSWFFEFFVYCECTKKKFIHKDAIANKNISLISNAKLASSHQHPWNALSNLLS